MHSRHLIHAALLAAALAAAAPQPASAGDQRGSQLLQLLMLFKRAPQVQAAAQRPAKIPATPARARPPRPAVTRPSRPALLAATGIAPAALPIAEDPLPLTR